jgi:hypothetical protein
MSYESDDMSQNIVGPHKYPLLNWKSFCKHNSMPCGDAHMWQWLVGPTKPSHEYIHSKRSQGSCW